MNTRESSKTADFGEARATVPFTCPGCGWTGEFDGRFTTWCERCGYGADPQPGEVDKPRVVRRRARARARSVAQFEVLRTAKSLRPASATGVAVTVLATLVHLTVALLFAGSAWLVLGPHQPMADRFFGVLGLGVAFVGRPRLLRRKPKKLDGWKERGDAPLFFALLDTCAAELGVATPDRVGFGDMFNASTSRYGLPAKPYLTIGVPIWSVLSGQERVALLGHELAHQANGDISHGVWASSAQRTLAELLALLDPRQSPLERRLTRRRSSMYGRKSTGTSGAFDRIAPMFAAVVFGPLFLVMWAYRRGLRKLDLACGHRAEYLADELGARLGSSAAVIGVMDALALSDSAQFYLRQQANSSRGLLDYLHSIPEHEKRRRVFLQEAEGTRVDATHPPTYLRRALLTARPQLPGTVHIDEAQWALIDAELTRRRDW